MITFSEIGAADRDHYDDCVTRLPEPDFRQTYGWGEVREADGWVPRRFLATGDGVAVGCAQVLIGRLPHLPFRLIQVPGGPLIDYHSPETVRAFAELLREVGQEFGACFARIEPQLPDGDEMVQSNLAAAGFARSSLAWSFWNSPLEVLRIDLRKSEEDLFRHLSKSKRYDTRRFLRRGNTVDLSTSADDFWQLHRFLRQLGARKGFAVRGERYWRALWDEFASRGRGLLVAARSQGRPLGYVFGVIAGTTCFVLHAADNQELRAAEQPNAALWWEIVRQARASQCTAVDLLGYVSTSHLRFKESLGGELLRFAGYHDLRLRSLASRAFTVTEKYLLPRLVPSWARLRGRTTARTSNGDRDA